MENCSYKVYAHINKINKIKSNIYHHLRGDYPTAYGYRWEYV